jgi:hypothetical protein
MDKNLRSKLKDPSHPYRAKLKAAGIPQSVAAYNLGVGYQQFIKYLAGSCQMPSQVEKKLDKLLQDIKS